MLNLRECKKTRNIIKDMCLNGDGGSAMNGTLSEWCLNHYIPTINGDTSGASSPQKINNMCEVPRKFLS